MRYQHTISLPLPHHPLCHTVLYHTVHMLHQHQPRGSTVRVYKRNMLEQRALGHEGVHVPYCCTSNTLIHVRSRKGEESTMNKEIVLIWNSTTAVGISLVCGHPAQTRVMLLNKGAQPYENRRIMISISV